MIEHGECLMGQTAPVASLPAKIPPRPSLISIIINNYNYAPYLRECIESALAQDTTAFELIIVDDGSSDGSVDIINPYKDRCRVIFKKNGGQASAMNAGFEASIGDLIWFLDSDDRIYSNSVSRVLGMWSSTWSKLHSPLDIIDQDSVPSGKTHPRRPLASGSIVGHMKRYGSYNSAPTSGNVFSREFLMEIMPIPEEKWRGHADCYLIFSAPFFGEIGVVDKALASYRIHGNNMTAFAVQGKIHIAKLAQELERDKKQEDMINLRLLQTRGDHAGAVITDSYYHLIMRLLIKRLSDNKSQPQEAGTFQLLVQTTRAVLVQASGFKMVALLSWLGLIAIMPRRFLSAMAARVYTA